jgi:hypothetical protein
MMFKGFSCFVAYSKNQQLSFVKSSRESFLTFHARAKLHLETQQASKKGIN